MQKRTLLIIGLVCIVIGIVVAFFVSATVDQRPEKELSKIFLQSSQIIGDLFGQPLTIAYKPEGSGVSFFGDGKLEGKYRFVVKGSKESGIVKVLWRSESKENFQVDRVELLKRGAKPELIWQKALPE